MSLVDYGSSSEDEGAEMREREEEEDEAAAGVGGYQFPEDDLAAPVPRTVPQNQRSGRLSNQQPETTLHLRAPSMEKLPDASFLLNASSIAPHMYRSRDHCSLVAAALSENPLRKRDANELPPSVLRSKIPKGVLPHSRSVPDTLAGALVPPQLRGRSNVVTEDISKLFVRKQADQLDR